METTNIFWAGMRQQLLSISTKRGINRKNQIESVCVEVKNYILKQENIILTLTNKLSLHHGDTVSKLQEIIETQSETIKAKEEENTRLIALKKRMIAFGEKQIDEIDDLRKKLGIKMPTFLEDKELT